MKYFIIEGSEKVNPTLGRDAIDALREPHAQYLRDAVAAGKLLFNGPKVGAVGGCMLLKADSYEDAWAFVNGDPYAKAGIREERIVEVKPVGCQDCVKDWFE